MYDHIAPKTLIIENIEYQQSNKALAKIAFERSIPIYRFFDIETEFRILLIESITGVNAYIWEQLEIVYIPSWLNNIVSAIDQQTNPSLMFKGSWPYMQGFNDQYSSTSCTIYCLKPQGFLSNDSLTLICVYYNQPENLTERNNIINEYLLKQV